MANGDQAGWWILADVSGNVLKKYPNPEAASPKDRPNLTRIYSWPVDAQGQPEPKDKCKLTKAKKTVKIDNKDYEFDGEIKIKE